MSSSAQSSTPSPEISISLEQALLSAVMLDQQFVYLYDELPSDAFGDARHAAIWDAMRGLHKRGLRVDAPMVAAELERLGHAKLVGGISYLVSLDLVFPDLSSVDSYVIELRERRLRRLAQAAAVEAARRMRSSSEDPVAISQSLRLRLQELEQEVSNHHFAAWGPLVEEVAGRLVSREVGKPLGLSTGFIDFDRLTQGLEGGQLLILAARPGVGKTSLALNIAYNVAVNQGRPVAYYSLEMSRDELTMRVLSSSVGIAHAKLRAGYIHDGQREQLTAWAKEIADAPLLIADEGTMSMSAVAAAARKQADRGLALIVVDYLQLMQPDRKRDNRAYEVADISRGLKALARDLRVPVLALSQLNRDAEREKRPPRLSDLRDSGALEQDADLVAFLHRPEGEISPTSQLVELRIDKHRSGPTSTIKLLWRPEYMRFDSLSQRDIA